MSLDYNFHIGTTRALKGIYNSKGQKAGVLSPLKAEQPYTSTAYLSGAMHFNH